MLRDPWRLLEFLLDGPLHPGGSDATESLMDRAKANSGTRLLDLGCGAGDAVALAHERGVSAVGLDRQPTGIGSVKGDLTSLPFQDDSFDVVLGECVLCLSPRPRSDPVRCRTHPESRGRLAFSDVTVVGTPPVLPAPIDELLCLDGPRERTYIRQQIEKAGFDIDDIQTHHDDLLMMRDRLQERLDFERLIDALGDRGSQLRDGAMELETAIESGHINYVSIVAIRQS